jgi:hypothetical protein
MTNSPSERSPIFPRSHVRYWWSSVLLLALLPCLSGCLVIEKKTLVLVVPPESKEVRMYYVFEGLSVLEGGELNKAEEQLDSLKKEDFSFFLSQDQPTNSPLVKHLRFSDLRFFLDLTRKRSLCADRRVTILDRDAFARELNEGISQTIRTQWDGSAYKIQARLREVSTQLDDKEAEKTANDFGVGPLMKTARGLVRIALGFDRESIERIKAAAGNRFNWVRFEPGTIRLVFPVTPECARKVVGDAKVAAWLEEMRSLAEPISLVANGEGLVITLGKSPIYLRYRDGREHRPGLEADLIRHAGEPGPLSVDDRAANADRLIKAFVAEARKKR